MFNNYNLFDDEILKVIKDYENLIYKYSIIDNKFDEDLYQDIIISIFKSLSKNRKNKKF